MFKVYDTPPEGMDNFTRTTWPFSTMEVGQTVEIASEQSELHTKARVAAHAHANKTEKKFSTKTGKNGSLYIQRVN